MSYLYPRNLSKMCVLIKTFLSPCSNQSARKLSQFAESAMAVKRVILQQFSMQLNYMNKERSNIYQPSAQQQAKNSDSAFSLSELKPKKAPNASSCSDDEHYEFKRDSESCDSHPTTPSETSDEDIQTILDNVLINNSNNNAMKNIISKCDEASCQKAVDSPLQSRRRQARQLFIICPTPSG